MPYEVILLQMRPATCVDHSLVPVVEGCYPGFIAVCFPVICDGRVARVGDIQQSNTPTWVTDNNTRITEQEQNNHKYTAQGLMY